MSAHPHIRVGTWNLWWRFGAWERRRRTIARVLELVDADVLGLQEVWSTERENQAEALGAFVAEKGDGDLPAVITGDFNAEPDSDEIRLLEGHKTAPAVPGQVFVDAWRFADAGSPDATWDSCNPHAAALGFPDSRIDYVFVGMPASGRGRVLGVRRFGAAPVDGVWASDHFGVLAHIAAAGPA